MRDPANIAEKARKLVQRQLLRGFEARTESFDYLTKWGLAVVDLRGSAARKVAEVKLNARAMNTNQDADDMAAAVLKKADAAIKKARK